MWILTIFLIIIIFSLLKSSSGEKVILVMRKRGHKRSDKNRIVDLEFSPDDRKYIFELFQNTCFNCGSKKNLTIDHHLPLEKGFGLKSEDGNFNAVLLCSHCNRQKSNKMPNKFYSKEKLQILEEKYGLKIVNDDINKDYYLEYKNSIVEFLYSGKVYIGKVTNIIEKELRLLGVKSKLYLEIEVNGKKKLFPFKEIKKIKKVKEPN